MSDYYALLGVPRGADDHTIKQEAEEKFKSIAEAYEVLFADAQELFNAFFGGADPFESFFGRSNMSRADPFGSFSGGIGGGGMQGMDMFQSSFGGGFGGGLGGSSTSVSTSIVNGVKVTKKTTTTIDGEDDLKNAEREADDDGLRPLANISKDPRQRVVADKGSVSADSDLLFDQRTSICKHHG
ncbi:MAG: hypothetical protein SGPRY_002894 [Prymnesium sp.]